MNLGHAAASSIVVKVAELAKKAFYRLEISSAYSSKLTEAVGTALMSADPEVPVDPNRRSGGHVIRNMIYQHDSSHNIEIVTGWKDQGTREYNQQIAPPAKLDLSPKHPCYPLNEQLVRCSLECPMEMKLAGRIASCNSERKNLMVCLTKNKSWKEEPVSAWYKFF